MGDLKYLFAYTIPLSTFVSFYLGGYFSFFTLGYAFIIIPLLELLLNETDKKYSEIERQSRLKNLLFDIMLYLNLPIVFFLLIYGLNKLSVNNYETYEIIGLLYSLGILLATNAINVGHELGHRKNILDRTLSKILLLPCLYMHFYLEHNLGHHKNVGTEEDPVTAKYNQSVFHFWIQAVIKQYFNAWSIQLKLLKFEKRSFLSIKNDMFFYIIFQTLYLFVLYNLMGLSVVFYGVIIAVISFLFLETINYIEHYGLKRNKLPSGRYERVEKTHSWNSNHIVGRIVLYELTRHSDHHYKSSKKYQILENIKESPQLPFGYPTSMLLAIFPPLWFYVMNKRVPKEMIS